MPACQTGTPVHSRTGWSKSACHSPTRSSEVARPVVSPGTLWSGMPCSPHKLAGVQLFPAGVPYPPGQGGLPAALRPDLQGWVHLNSDPPWCNGILLGRVLAPPGRRGRPQGYGRMDRQEVRQVKMGGFALDFSCNFRPMLQCWLPLFCKHSYGQVGQANVDCRLHSFTTKQGSSEDRTSTRSEKHLSHV